jgi:hypothetical protein
VGKCFGTAAEAHALAEIIPPTFAVITVITHDTSLDCDALARHEIFDPRTDSGYYTCCLMTEYEWCLYREVTIPALQIIMQIAATQAG